MKRTVQSHLRRLDEALLLLCDERLRLLQEIPPAERPGASAEHLLRHHRGPLDAQSVRELFRWLDRTCGVLPRREDAP